MAVVVVVGTGGGGRRNSLLRKDHMDNEEQLPSYLRGYALMKSCWPHSFAIIQFLYRCTLFRGKSEPCFCILMQNSYNNKRLFLSHLDDLAESISWQGAVTSWIP